MPIATSGPPHQLLPARRLVWLLREIILPLAVLITLALTLYRPSFDSRLDLGDEHQLVRLASSTLVHPQAAGHQWNIKLDPVKSYFQFLGEMIGQGRFQPLTYTKAWLEGILFGPQPFPLRVLHVSLAILTCLVMYRAARRFGAPDIAALLALLWISIAGNASFEVWVRYIVAEADGLMFTAIGLWAITYAVRRPGPNRWDVVTAVAAVLAAWFKESFLLIIPALALLRLALATIYGRQRWVEAAYQLRYWLGGSALFFVAQVALILILIRTHPGGYGAVAAGLGLSSFDPRAWFARLDQLKTYAAYYVPIGLGLAFTLPDFARSRRSLEYLAVGMLLAALAILPQFVLYSGWFMDRYYYPTLLVLAAANAIGITLMWRRSWGRLALIPCAAFALAVLIPVFEDTSVHASSFAARTRAIDRALTCVNQTIREGQVVVIAADPAGNFEEAIAIMMFLGAKGSTPPIYIYPVYTAADPAAYQDIRVGLLFNDYYRGYIDDGSLPVDRIGAIIYLVKPREFMRKPPGWFLQGRWDLQIFSEPVEMLSPLQGIRPAYVFDYRIRLPATSHTGDDAYHQRCATADPPPQ